MAVASEASGGDSLHPQHCLARLSSSGGIVLHASSSSVSSKQARLFERGIGVGSGIGSARWGLWKLAEVEDLDYIRSKVGRVKTTGGRVASQQREPAGAGATADTPARAPFDYGPLGPGDILLSMRGLRFLNAHRSAGQNRLSSGLPTHVPDCSVFCLMAVTPREQ